MLRKNFWELKKYLASASYDYVQRLCSKKKGWEPSSLNL